MTNKDELIEKDNFSLLMYDLPVQSLKALESVDVLHRSSSSNGKRTYKVNVPEVDRVMDRLSRFPLDHSIQPTFDFIVNFILSHAEKYVPVDGRRLLRAHL